MQMRILIVDDSPDKISAVTRLINGLVTELCFEPALAVAGTVSQAIATLGSKKFDLLLLDLFLPMRDGDLPRERGGLELLRKLERSDRLFIPSHVITLSAFPDIRSKQLSEFGRLAVLTVPFSEECDEWEEAVTSIVRHVVRAKRFSGGLEENSNAAKRQMSPAGPTIGVLTALPKECSAVRLMMEDEARRFVPGEGGGRQYYIGRVPAANAGDHAVVVALLPDQGNNNAAVRAMQLLSHFSTVRHVIMCGIAGGVPRPGEQEHDVRLGDIVVSNRNGVVQYDLVKENPDGCKELRHPPRPPGVELLEAVRHLASEEELHNYPWEKYLVRGSKLRSGMRPADNLNAQGYPISYPVDSMRKAGLPRVFSGTIAASNTLLKNRVLRDWLGNHFGVKAVEMEGSGVADATWSDSAGYLVVRGICDYCDENKGDVWQGAAAIAAAAYVRALIEAMPIDASITNE